MQEYQGAGTVVVAYLYGPSGLVKNVLSGNYYYQDGSGSTSHLASSLQARGTTALPAFCGGAMVALHYE